MSRKISIKQRERDEEQERMIRQLECRYATVLKKLDNRSIFSILIDELVRLHHNDTELIFEAKERWRTWK